LEFIRIKFHYFPLKNFLNKFDYFFFFFFLSEIGSMKRSLTFLEIASASCTTGFNADSSMPCPLSTNYDDKDEEGGERKVRKKKKSKGKKTTRTSIPNHDYNHLIIVNQII